jgi:hypothetical protein
LHLQREPQNQAFITLLNTNSYAPATPFVGVYPEILRDERPRQAFVTLKLLAGVTIGAGAVVAVESNRKK